MLAAEYLSRDDVLLLRSHDRKYGCLRDAGLLGSAVHIQQSVPTGLGLFHERLLSAC
jgi:hypothetical protein